MISSDRCGHDVPMYLRCMRCEVPHRVDEIKLEAAASMALDLLCVGGMYRSEQAQALRDALGLSTSPVSAEERQADETQRSVFTEADAQRALGWLSEHYGCPVMPVSRYCNALDEWAKVAKPEGWLYVRGAIAKSCLLHRTIYGGEALRTVPCPVHKGRWSGISLGWPGAVSTTGVPIKEEKLLREQYDAGCRCFLGSCGCTTGWQPNVTPLAQVSAP